MEYDAPTQEDMERAGGWNAVAWPTTPETTPALATLSQQLALIGIVLVQIRDLLMSRT